MWCIDHDLLNYFLNMEIRLCIGLLEPSVRKNGDTTVVNKTNFIKKQTLLSIKRNQKNQKKITTASFWDPEFRLQKLWQWEWTLASFL